MTWYFESLPSEPVSASVETPRKREPFGAPQQRKMAPILGTITGAKQRVAL